MSKQNDAAWYGTTFKAWPKDVGSKPTADMLANVHLLGLRPGKQAMANAMALRGEGVTNAQIVQVCGNPQLNRMRGLIADKLVKRVPVSNSEAGHTVYKLELTAKGLARIEARRKAADAADAEGKVAKPVVKKATSKPRKPAKGTAAKLPVVTPVETNSGGAHDMGADLPVATATALPVNAM